MKNYSEELSIEIRIFIKKGYKSYEDLEAFLNKKDLSQSGTMLLETIKIPYGSGDLGFGVHGTFSHSWEIYAKDQKVIPNLFLGKDFFPEKTNEEIISMLKEHWKDYGIAMKDPSTITRVEEVGHFSNGCCQSFEVFTSYGSTWSRGSIRLAEKEKITSTGCKWRPQSL